VLSFIGWRRLWWLGFLGLLPIVVPGVGALRVFLLFFLAPVVADVVTRIQPRKDTEAPIEEGDLHLPGPAQRYGVGGFLLRYHLSLGLSVFNPFQLRQVFEQVRGDRSARRRRGGRDVGSAPYRQKVEYRLPFAGEWLVMNGGVTPESSHSWELVSQRYAYDFVVADETGVRHGRDGSRREHYFCYGRPVLAPADGVVVEVRDGIPDAPRVGSGWLDWLCRDFRGNSVTIQHAEEEYSFSAHLIPGSICVRPGQQVREGQQIGGCGHSGHSTEPHLHFQVQDRPDFFRARGLPVRITGCRIDGEVAREPTFLESGMRVRRTEDDSRLAAPDRSEG
jgi:murein DD-endopeptidase MepM/ murein hydrolase activator NlpD